MSRCPYCRSREKWNMGRTRWMRWTPGHMRNWRCGRCGHEFAVWLRLFTMRHGFARGLVTAWHWILVSALLLAAAWGLPPLLDRLFSEQP